MSNSSLFRVGSSLTQLSVSRWLPAVSEARHLFGFFECRDIQGLT